MACPFFLPIEKLENGPWLHAHRLPLGCGWTGHCTAPEHDGETPTLDELQNFCNLGYAEACGRLPRERAWDSIRFSARTLGNGASKAGGNGTNSFIQVHYVCERAHRPAGHGFLQFDLAAASCVEAHGDTRLQRMAECFVASYLEKRMRNELPQATDSICNPA